MTLRTADAGRTLFFGDCLDVMRQDIAPDSVDLIYLDPPFNSKKIYNASMGGAQWMAFDDTWRWHRAVDDFHDVAGCVKLGPTMEGLRTMLGEESRLAYLSYMANRVRECHRRSQSHWYALSPLRPNDESLLEGRHGRDLRAS